MQIYETDISNNILSRTGGTWDVVTDICMKYIISQIHAAEPARREAICSWACWPANVQGASCSGLRASNSAPRLAGCIHYQPSIIALTSRKTLTDCTIRTIWAGSKVKFFFNPSQSSSTIVVPCTFRIVRQFSKIAI